MCMHLVKVYVTIRMSQLVTLAKSESLASGHFTVSKLKNASSIYTVQINYCAYVLKTISWYYYTHILKSTYPID